MEPIFLIVPVVVMGAPVLIALIFMRYRHVQTQARYRMLIDLADKGVALPEALLAEPQTPLSERRRALVLIAAGLGLMAMFATLPFKLDGGLGVGSLWGLGLLPLMTGLGYLASWWLSWRGDVRG
jgi:hypothetical protein